MNSPKSRWSSRMEFASGPNGRSSTGDIAWVDDPLKAKEIKSRMAQSFPIDTPVEPGKSYTLHAMVGSRGGSLSLKAGEDTASLAKTIDVAVFLRAAGSTPSRPPGSRIRGRWARCAAPRPPEG